MRSIRYLRDASSTCVKRLGATATKLGLARIASDVGPSALAVMCKRTLVLNALWRVSCLRDRHARKARMTITLSTTSNAMAARLDEVVSQLSCNTLTVVDANGWMRTLARACEDSATAEEMAHYPVRPSRVSRRWNSCRSWVHHRPRSAAKRPASGLTRINRQACSDPFGDQSSRPPHAKGHPTGSWARFGNGHVAFALSARQQGAAPAFIIRECSDRSTKNG